MSILSVIESVVHSHPRLAALPALWSALSAIVNLMLRINTVAQWEADAEHNPRFHAFANLMRKYGLDPTCSLQFLITMVNGKAAASSAKQA